MSESSLVELMQSVGVVHECLNAFFYISNGLNEAQEDTSFVSQPGVEQSILLESGLARSIVSRVIRTLHFASCIVAGKKQCVNIIKKKLPDQYLRLWLFSLLVYQSPYYAWLSVFSQLLQLDPNLIGELFWLATTLQKQGTEEWLSKREWSKRANPPYMTLFPWKLFSIYSWFCVILRGYFKDTTLLVGLSGVR